MVFKIWDASPIEIIEERKHHMGHWEVRANLIMTELQTFCKLKYSKMANFGKTSLTHVEEILFSLEPETDASQISKIWQFLVK